MRHLHSYAVWCSQECTAGRAAKVFTSINNPPLLTGGAVVTFGFALQQPTESVAFALQHCALCIASLGVCSAISQKRRLKRAAAKYQHISHMSHWA